MDGIKKIRIIPSYFSDPFNQEDLTDIKIIRAPESFAEFSEVLQNLCDLKKTSLLSSMKDLASKITNERSYQEALQNSKETYLNIYLTRKQKKPSNEIPVNIHICKSHNQRGIKFINVITKKEKILRSELFSKTSRYISLGDLVYITGGRKIPQQVLIIDTKNWEISQGPSLNEGRYWHGITLINQKIAVVGGTKGENKQKESLSSVEVLENNRWVDYPKLSKERSEPGCGYFHQYTFVLLGHRHSNSTSVYVKDVERWNGHYWEEIFVKVPLLDSPAVFALNENEILIIGGWIKETPQKSVLKLNIKNQVISEVCSLKKGDVFSYNQVCKISNTLFLSGNHSALTSISLNL